MVSIDYDKLNEVSVALKKLYEMVQYNLEGSKLGYNSICITPLEALMCPQIGNFEDDMDMLQARGNESLEDIQELITGIHNVIYKFQESESKIARDINAATVSSSLLALGSLVNKNIVSNGSILPNESITSDNTDTKKTDKTNTIDDFILAASTAGAVGATDKVISTASEKGLLGKRTYTVVRKMNRFNRRARKLSSTYEVTKKSVRLREGFGVVGGVLAAGIAVEDVKNNDNTVDKVAAVGIDEGSTAAAWVASDYLAPLAATFAVGVVETGAAAIGIVALPEIAVGAVAVTGAVVAVGVVNFLASTVASTFKESLDLK